MKKLSLIILALTLLIGSLSYTKPVFAQSTTGSDCKEGEKDASGNSCMCTNDLTICRFVTSTTCSAQSDSCLCRGEGAGRRCYATASTYTGDSFSAGKCTNTFTGVLSKGQSATAKAVDSEYDNIVSLNNRASTSQLLNLNVVAIGTLGKCAESNASVLDFMKQEYEPGAIQYASTAAVQAFFETPSSNIGAHYANLLLPKEFVNQGGTAYAAAECDDGDIDWFNPSEALKDLGIHLSLTRPPMCKSTTYFWNTGLGLSSLWGVSFSLSMVLVVVMLVVSGFMIMFRSRLGGQTVVTVSMALQSIIIASVMALASFAVGAFFVNLSKALTLLVANLFLAMLWQGFPDLVKTLFGTTFLSDPIGLTAKLLIVMFTGDFVKWVGDLSGGTGDVGGLLSLGGGSVGEVFSGIIAPLSTLTFKVGASILLSPIYLVIRLIIAGAILVASFRIVWTLVKTYIKMAIDVVAAPLIFVISAVPGSSTAVQDWIKRMFKNALIPPLMFAVVNVAVYLTLFMAVKASSSSIDPLTAVTGGALPPSSLGMLALGMGPQAIVMVVLLNMAPSVPTAVEDLFTGKNSGAMGKATGEMVKSLQKIPVAGSMFS